MGESRDEYIHCVDPPRSFISCEFPPFDSDIGLAARLFGNGGGHEKTDKRARATPRKGLIGEKQRGCEQREVACTPFYTPRKIREGELRTIAEWVFEALDGMAEKSRRLQDSDK